MGQPAIPEGTTDVNPYYYIIFLDAYRLATPQDSHWWIEVVHRGPAQVVAQISWPPLMQGTGI